MSDPRELIDRHLRKGNMEALEFLDIVPIPAHGDHMLRLRTLEEALEDFAADEDTVSYLIHVKARRGEPQAARIEQISANSAPSGAENVYLQDGALNIPYLAQNAELLLEAREYALARNIFQAIASSGERRGLALFGVGRCDEAEGRFEDARVHYEESIAYHPTLESYHRLSSVFMAQKKDQLAAETLERALSLKDLHDPNAARTRLELHKTCGNCWTRARNVEAAEKHFHQALEIDPSADDIRSNLGALYLQTQNVGKARRCFEDALTSNPRNERALEGVASCHLAIGDKRQAHDAFARALEVAPNNPTAIYHLVKCAYEIKSYATAARVVEEYVQIAPVNVNLLYSLAGLQYHLGRHDDARATAEQILRLHAEHGGAKDLLKLIER